ncbi:triadin-like [Genypterus blacodes]|uniref:triadin-like n=1 Tax=Genypterus blacodes TaxID=154954 RepID=UPI003F76C0A3
MSGRPANGVANPPPRSYQRTFWDEVVMTFTSPMAWLLVVALVITWFGVAIVLFDLLDYRTLTGLPPPSSVAKRVLRMKGGSRTMKSRPVAAPESTDWLQLLWTFVVSLVAPDEEEEGIQQLTESLTSYHSEEL